MFYPSSIGTRTINASVQSDAREANANARQASLDVQLMEQDISRLLMITEALWTLLKKEHHYTDDDLAKVVTEIDLRDGIRDGRSTKSKPIPCPSCSKINSSKRAVCIYCGKSLPLDPFGR